MRYSLTWQLQATVLKTAVPALKIILKLTTGINIKQLSGGLQTQEEEEYGLIHQIKGHMTKEEED